jgi:hypothetical protein
MKSCILQLAEEPLHSLELPSNNIYWHTPWPICPVESLVLKGSSEILPIRRMIVGVHWSVPLHHPDYFERYRDDLLNCNYSLGTLKTNTHSTMEELQRPCP